MANKFNHARKINKIQPAKFTAISPGMIITFNYGSGVKNINDKNPLILFLHFDSKTGVVDGLNLNYLSNYRLKNLFDGFRDRTIVTKMDEEDSNLLAEDFTQVVIPSPLKLQTGSPSEVRIEMGRMYKKFLKKPYSDVYRSYKPNRMRSLKVVEIKV